jgi:hypothetical protein
MAQKLDTPVKLNPSTTKEAPRARSFLRDDFPILKKASISLAICLVLGLLLLGAARFFLVTQQAKEFEAKTELAQAQAQYSTATNEKNDVRNFQEKYLALVERGFIGEERRLDVIEQIQTIQERHQLLPISYEIFPQQVIDLDPSFHLATGQLELRGSKLVVNMGLLHEMDMLTFLSQLQSKGWIVPHSCEMKIGGVNSDSLIRARLLGECSLYWLSIGQRPPADGTAVPNPAQ